MRTQLGARLRLAAVCIVGLTVAHLLLGGLLASGYMPLGEAVARDGLHVDAQQKKVLGLQRRGREAQPVILRAYESPDLGEVYLAKGVLSSDGRVAALSDLHNLTRTSSADESVPLVMGNFALFARMIEHEVVGIEVLDLSGEAPTGQGVLSRLQRGITNLQQTGRWSGVGRRSYALRAPAQTFSAHADAGRFVIMLDDDRVVIDPALEKPREGADRFEVRTHATVVTALVPWVVDTVRAIPWIGAEPIAWLENKVFALRDQAKQAYHSVSSVDEEAEVAQELGSDAQSHKAQQKVERLAVPDPESGWHPPAIEQLTTPEV